MGEDQVLVGSCTCEQDSVTHDGLAVVAHEVCKSRQVVLPEGLEETSGSVVRLLGESQRGQGRQEECEGGGELHLYTSAFGEMDEHCNGCARLPSAPLYTQGTPRT